MTLTVDEMRSFIAIFTEVHDPRVKAAGARLLQTTAAQATEIRRLTHGLHLAISTLGAIEDESIAEPYLNEPVARRARGAKRALQGLVETAVPARHE